MVKWFAAGTACMFVAACAMGGAKRSASSPPTMAAPQNDASTAGGSPMPDDPHAKIDALYKKIETERGELGLAEYALPPNSPPAEPYGSIPKSTDATCKPAKNDTCTQSCTFSDSICDNANSICRIASDIPQDKWAADKCASAKQTCDSAHDKCCSCQ